MNDKPLVCRRLQAILLEDDTNLTAIGKQCADIKEDKGKNDGLRPNKLLANVSKTFQLNIRTISKTIESAQGLPKRHDRPLCKYGRCENRM